MSSGDVGTGGASGGAVAVAGFAVARAGAAGVAGALERLELARAATGPLPSCMRRPIVRELTPADATIGSFVMRSAGHPWAVRAAILSDTSGVIGVRLRATYRLVWFAVVRSESVVLVVV